MARRLQPGRLGRLARVKQDLPHVLLAVDEGRVAPRQREQDVDHAARTGRDVVFYIRGGGGRGGTLITPLFDRHDVASCRMACSFERNAIL